MGRASTCLDLGLSPGSCRWGFPSGRLSLQDESWLVTEPVSQQELSHPASPLGPEREVARVLKAGRLSDSMD